MGTDSITEQSLTDPRESSAQMSDTGDEDPATAGETISVTESLVREFPLVLILLVAVDLSMAGGVLQYLASVAGIPFEALGPAVPPSVYVFGLLGAGAYAVTSLVFEPKRSRLAVLRLGYRCAGALPLAAGVYLLSDSLVDTSEALASVSGLAFLAGLFVRLTLQSLGDVAKRLYGDDDDGSTAAADPRREKANATLRRGWQALDTASAPAEDQDRARRLLQGAATIVDDEEATRQELARAQAMSDRALAALLGHEGDGETTGT